MNKTNPFMQQGTLQEQKDRKRARFFLAVYSAIGFTTLLMMFFLIQGCKKEPAPETINLGVPEDTNSLASASSNAPVTGAPMDTNISTLPVVSNSAPTAVTPPSTPSTGAATGTVTPPAVPTTASVAPVPAVPMGSKTYTIAKGDSFYTIAKKLGVKIKDIQNLNPEVNSSKLKVNQTINVPDTGAASVSTPGSSAAATAAGSDASSETYTVKSGDSLFKIAKSHGTTVNALKTLNGLKTNALKVNQKLKVPVKAVPAEVPVAPPVTVPAPTPTPANAPAGATSTTAPGTAPR